MYDEAVGMAQEALGEARKTAGDMAVTLKEISKLRAMEATVEGLREENMVALERMAKIEAQIKNATAPERIGGRSVSGRSLASRSSGGLWKAKHLMWRGCPYGAPANKRLSPIATKGVQY